MGKGIGVFFAIVLGVIVGLLLYAVQLILLAIAGIAITEVLLWVPGFERYLVFNEDYPYIAHTIMAFIFIAKAPTPISFGTEIKRG